MISSSFPRFYARPHQALLLRRPGGWPSKAAGVHCSSRRRRRPLAVAPTGGGAEPKHLTILHFNDVYNIEPRAEEPVGGAARFVSALRTEGGAPRETPPLVLFSGDALNPSLMSAFTRGEQMVPVLNAAGVSAAMPGNHDIDFGIELLRVRMAGWRFPLVCSNVLHAATGEPLAGAHRRLLLSWHGVRVGLLGLVERDWLATIPSLEDGELCYLDFVGEGRRLARQLLDEGAELVVALTHMRLANDRLLAAGVPELGLVLGGHDHTREAERVEPYGTPLIKSGTDFREFSVVEVELPPRPPGAAAAGARPPAPVVRWRRVEVTSEYPEDPDVAAVVAQYQQLIGDRMDAPLGYSHTPLDARFEAVRGGESALGGLLADAMRLALGADVALLNGGTIRSDRVHGPGPLTMRDFVSMLPFTDELVLVQLSGSDLLAVMETGVGAWPAREGRFLQVSGVSFEFDPSRPKGQRIVRESITVAGQPLVSDRLYKVATKAYLQGGKDGFESLRRARTLVDAETAPRLATLVHHLLSRVQAMNDREEASGSGRQGGNGSSGHPPAPAQAQSQAGRCELAGGAAVPSRGSSQADGCGAAAELAPSAAPPGPGGLQPEPCAHELDCLVFYDASRGKHGVAPRLGRRIVRREAPSAAAAGAQ